MGMGTMLDLQKLLIEVQPEITRINRNIETDIEELSHDYDDLLIKVLRYSLLEGGKRFRPLLAVIAAGLCGGNGHDIYRLAIAFEYLHVATLIHDDVIDNAEYRRGKKSVYKEFGLTSAILAGDFLHARSMAIIGELGGSKALNIFCRATGGMVDGEFIQMRNTKRLNQSEYDYFQAINGKTALLIGATTEIGAIIGGGNQEQQSVLREYGLSLGAAFQIVDDLLDYLGDEALTGKAVGNDLVEGKITLPLIHSLEKATQDERSRLLPLLEQDTHGPGFFSEVKDFISKYEGFDYTQKKAEELVQVAMDSLSIFSNDPSHREISILKGLTQYVLTRKK